MLYIYNHCICIGHLYSDIQQQFLCVPSHSALYSGRTSPSVTGSIQSDPESCMDVSKYQQDDSDDEGMGTLSVKVICACGTLLTFFLQFFRSNLSTSIFPHILQAFY